MREHRGVIEFKKWRFAIDLATRTFLCFSLFSILAGGHELGLVEVLTHK